MLWTKWWGSSALTYALVLQMRRPRPRQGNDQPQLVGRGPSLQASASQPGVGSGHSHHTTVQSWADAG